MVVGRLVFSFSLLILLGVVVTCCFRNTITASYTIVCPTQWTSTYLFGQDKQVDGYLVDLMQEIGKEKRIDIDVVMVPESEIRAIIEKKKADGFLSAMPRNFVVDRQYDSSLPLFSSGYLMVVRKDSTKASLDACVNMNVGYTSVSRSYLQSSTHPIWREYLYDTVYGALDDLSKGRIDGVLIDSLNMQVLSTGYYANMFRVLLPPVSMREIRVFVPHSIEGKKLVDHIDSVVDTFKFRRVMKQLLEYWELCSLANEEKSA